MTQLEQIRRYAIQGVDIGTLEDLFERKLTGEEIAVYRGLLDPGRRPMTDLERQHKHREAAREIGELPPPADPWSRAMCRYTLLGFGLHYCREKCDAFDQPLLKRPPSPRMERFIFALQKRIFFGGLKHVRWPRGRGKSTWVKIALIWAAVYGHRRFLVVVEKTKGSAKVFVDECWRRIYSQPRLAADFPEFAIPMRDISLRAQRIRVQTYRGVATAAKMDVSTFNYYKFPTLVGYPDTGAIIAFRGSDQSIRGINIDSRRPDFFFLDDPQTDEEARNPESVRKIEDEICGAILGAGSADETVAAVMASTVIEPDDVSETFADPKKHPEWETETETLIVKWGPEQYVAEYIRRLEVDPADARQWYADNRGFIELGVEVFDDDAFDVKVGQISAYQAALELLHVMKPRKFYADMQMIPNKAQGIYRISADDVAKRVNGVPFGVVPLACDQGVLAFVDVNSVAGLRWELCAFGRGRIAATLAYGQYPAPGVRLFKEGIPRSAIPGILAPALRAVAAAIAAVQLKREDGTLVKCSGICFDGGWETETIAITCQEITATGTIPCVWSKGFDARSYSWYHHDHAPQHPGLANGEFCHLWTSANGTFLAIHSDYWKEVSQTSFFADPLTPSSSSFYGDSPITHRQFAQEICNEELRSKHESHKVGTVWEWFKDPNRPNHYGDVHAGVLAYGSICKKFDPVARAVGAEEMVASAKQKKIIYKLKK